MGPSPEDTRPSADEALARLIEGNHRFLRGEARRAAFRRESLADLAKAQRPYATILGCSDSRVPPEWIFDTGLGELFVVRVAGNILSPEIAGSLQYAGSYLETPLFVVLGHEGCGAISAALATKHEGEQFRSRVQLLLASIVPGLPISIRSFLPKNSCRVPSKATCGGRFARSWIRRRDRRGRKGA